MHRFQRRNSRGTAEPAPRGGVGADGSWPGDPVLAPGQRLGPDWCAPDWSEELAALEHTPTGSRLCAVVEDLDPWDMTEAELVEAIAAMERQSAWTAAQQARFVRELGERRSDQDGHEDIADDVAARLAITRGAAHRLIDRAQALGRSPELEVALAHGRVDVRKVDALTDATTGLTDLEARIIHRALLPGADRLTARQLGNRAKKAALGVDGALATARRDAAAQERSVTLTPAPDAMAWLTFYLPAEDAVAAFTALDRLAANPAPGDDRPVGARRADALTRILGDVLATGQAPDGTPVPAPAGARPHIVITIERETLAGANEHPAHLDGYGPIPAVVARRLAEHATTSTILVDPATGRHLGPAHDDSSTTTTTGTPIDESVPEHTRTSRPDHPGEAPPEHTRTSRPDHPGEAPPEDSGAGPSTPAVAAHPDPADPAGLLVWVQTHHPDCDDPQQLIRAELGLLTTDAYTPSTRLRRLVMERDRTCRFPTCSVPARRCQLDHIVPFDPTLPAWAQTTEANLHALCLHHHIVKTRKLWTVERDHGTGITTWRSPTGHTYERAPEAMIDGPLVADLDRERLLLSRLSYRDLYPGFRPLVRSRRELVGYALLGRDLTDPPASAADLVHPDARRRSRPHRTGPGGTADAGSPTDPAPPGDPPF